MNEEYQETPDAVVAAYARATVLVMERMTPEQRLDLIREITDYYCTACGYEHPKVGQCQCWNDE